MMIKTILAMCIIGCTAAASSMDCSFETGFCKWHNDQNNWELNWEITDLDQFGMFDKSGQEINGACIKSTKLGDHGRMMTSRLWGPAVSKFVKIKCFTFQYRLQGIKGGLTLMRREMGSCVNKKDDKTGLPMVSCLNRPIWNSENDKPSLSHETWQNINIDLSESESDFKLILEGTIPSGNPNAKICVDNITSSADPCPVPVPENLANTRSFSSWVELFGMTFAGALALGLTIPIAVFVVCLFERKRRRGKKNKRIIRHADELDLPEGINTTTCEDTNPLPQRYANSQVGVGHPRLMNRAMSTPAGTNGQGGNYTMGKRNGTPQQTMGPRSNSGQMSHTMGRGGLDGGWMMSSQHGDLMENDEYTIDSDYTTHRQMSVPANGYIPVASQGESGMMQAQVASMSALQQIPGQSVMFQNRQMPQPQSNVIAPTSASNNPFGAPTNVGIPGAAQDNRSLVGSHAVNFSTDENRATPGLPFYPPRYEEAMGFNHGQNVVMEEKPPLLPPRVPESSGSGAGTSCSTPLPPAPPPLPLSGHPSAGRFNVPLGNE